MGYLERAASNFKERRDRPVLTRRDPSIEKLLAGMTFVDQDIEALRTWIKQMLRARNSWSVRTACMRGIFGSRTLRREDADAALAKALAEMNGGAR